MAVLINTLKIIHTVFARVLLLQMYLLCQSQPTDSDVISSESPGTGPGLYISPTGAYVVAGLAFVALITIAGCTSAKTIRDL